jgi:biotin carboxyl carrier protein
MLLSGSFPNMTSHRRPGRKAYLLITLFAFLLVLFPFLFWYQTWFGRKLTDAQLDDYFADHSKPRHAQHALVQLGERLGHHQNVSRWYPQVLEVSSSPSLELRTTAAWIMGQDRNYPPFHEALLRLIHDPQPMVRRNAALALAVFGDPAARPELVRMLRPYTITATAAGPVKYRLKLGDYVNPGTLVAHIGTVEIRSAVPGEVRSLEKKDGATVRAGEPLADLAADKNHVWEALRALNLVGQPADLEDVEHFTRPVPGISDTVVRQASLTAEAIRSRQNAPAY